MNIFKPNLVLLNAGTNDATGNYSVDTVGSRMEDLIDYICKIVRSSWEVLIC